MTRYNDTTTVGTGDLKDFIGSLRAIAAMLEAGVNNLESRGFEQFETKNWKSANVARDDLSKFVGVVSEAIPKVHIPSLPTNDPAKTKKIHPKTSKKTTAPHPQRRLDTQ